MIAIFRQKMGSEKQSGFRNEPMEEAVYVCCHFDCLAACGKLYLTESIEKYYESINDDAFIERVFQHSRPLEIRSL